MGAIETLEDITESRHTEMQLARSRQAAEAANRAKSEFLANMSHEIRTPMTAVVGYADLIRGGCSKECDFGKRMLGNHMEVISKNAHLLLQIINDILDLSKIEAGRMEMECVVCEPFAVVSDVADLLRVQAAEKGLEVQVECAGPIPRTIRTDPTRFRQILINLVGNAIKFTDRGDVRLVLCLAPSLGSRPLLQIDVIDSGVGMSEGQLARLFKPFSQVDCSTTRKYGGTGLGLTISQRLAELLGGSIRVISASGQGSTFTLTVDPGPLKPGEIEYPVQENAGRAKATNPFPASEAPSISARVLLAEDGRDNQRLLEIILTKAGAEVTLADNGQIAVELALASRGEGSPFDLILMDMQMPVMDGYEATRRLRAEGWQGPVVALTAHAMTGDRQECIAAGCTDYASKPFGREPLLQLLARYAPASRPQPSAGESW